MKNKLVQILISTVFVYSILTILKCLTIFYFILTDEYFSNAEFSNEKLLLKSHNFLLYIKLFPILVFLPVAFLIKKLLLLKWLHFIASSFLALIIFRFFDLSINNIFMLTDNHIVNILIATIFNLFIIYLIYFLNKKYFPASIAPRSAKCS